jgi:hypothetical protein
MAHIWWVLSTTFAALAVEVTIVFLLALLPSVSPAFRAFSTAGGIAERRGNCPQQKFTSGVRAPGHAPASAGWAIFWPALDEASRVGRTRSLRSRYGSSWGLGRLG